MKLLLKSLIHLSIIAFIFSGCTKEDVDNPYLKPPKADAGDAKTITLPVSSEILSGTGTSYNGPVKGYLWSLISGPDVPKIENPGLPSTKVSGMIAGVYKFQLMVIDSAGLTGMDTTSITVISNNPVQTNIINPSSNPNEVFFSSYTPTSATKGNEQLSIAGWTAYSVPHAWRAFIKFDISSIPNNAIIQSAKLSLYSTLTPWQGNGVDAQYGTNNACYIQRATSNWTSNTISWNNQPTIDTTHEVTIPQSTSSFQNNLDLDVTNIYKDILTSNNYGLGIKLQNEGIYNIRQYASSFNSNADLHPKLVIVYKLP